MAFQPMPLSRRPLPFDHPEWIFELKYDGFRSLAFIQNGRTEHILGAFCILDAIYYTLTRLSSLQSLWKTD